MSNVKRIVLFKFKEGASQKSIDQIFSELKELKIHMQGIKDFVWGEYNETNEPNEDFTHAFVMTLEDTKARDYYAPHPKHLEIVEKYVSPILEKVLVFDFNENK
jgi:hypothetical protein